MSSTKKRKKKHRVARGFLIFQLIILGIVLAGLGFYYGSGMAAKITRLKDEADYLVAGSTRDTFKREETSVAYDKNGKTISVL